MRDYLIKRVFLLIPTFIGITLVVYAVDYRLGVL